jgi:hypothetical protein
MMALRLIDVLVRQGIFGNESAICELAKKCGRLAFHDRLPNTG